jgi:hypothetical protein
MTFFSDHYNKPVTKFLVSSNSGLTPISRFASIIAMPDSSTSATWYTQFVSFWDPRLVESSVKWSRSVWFVLLALNNALSQVGAVYVFSVWQVSPLGRFVYSYHVCLHTVGGWVAGSSRGERRSRDQPSVWRWWE